MRAAGVTRGALYHHFGGKESLFLAVFEDVEDELLERIGARVVASARRQPARRARAGIDEMLDAGRRPRVRADRADRRAGGARAGSNGARSAGATGWGSPSRCSAPRSRPARCAEQPLRPLAHVLLGALDEAVLYVARAEDQAAARAQMAAVLEALLGGLRAGAGGRSVRAMNVRLYVVNGSHPCATVESALQRKGIPYKVTESRRRCTWRSCGCASGSRTVPAITIDGEKISGSRAIMRRLDELVPEPPAVPGRPGRSGRASRRPRRGATRSSRATRGASCGRRSRPTRRRWRQLPGGLEAARAAGAGAEGDRPGRDAHRDARQRGDATTPTRATCARCPRCSTSVDGWIAEGVHRRRAAERGRPPDRAEPAPADGARRPAPADRGAARRRARAAAVPGLPGRRAGGAHPGRAAAAGNEFSPQGRDA